MHPGIEDIIGDTLVIVGVGTAGQLVSVLLGRFRVEIGADEEGQGEDEE